MSKALATRYAKALVENLKEHKGDFEKAYNELKKVVQALGADPRLFRYLSQPVVPRRDRLEMGKVLVEDLGLSPPLRNFVLILIEKERVAFLDMIIEEFRKLVDEVLGQVRGRVRTARPLTSQDLALLSRSFQELVGKKVVLEVEEEPSIIGGVVALVGGVVFDGSVKGNLEQIREKLIEG
jgi:F-type H+-transporting ATPase subunit delta